MDVTSLNLLGEATTAFLLEAKSQGRKNFMFFVPGLAIAYVACFNFIFDVHFGLYIDSQYSIWVKVRRT